MDHGDFWNQDLGRFLFASLFDLLSLELREVLNPTSFSESYTSLNDFCTHTLDFFLKLYVKDQKC
jgi:hypothetical protein